jgi:hypothetical protein
MAEKLEDVICERILSNTDAGEVKIRIGKPHPDKWESAYVCPYQIVGFGD